MVTLRAAAPQRHEASVRTVLALDRREGYAGPAWGGTTAITLPTSWGQALIDGTARGRPVLLGVSQYAKLNNLATDSQCDPPHSRVGMTWR